jgi:hypothetical protein
MTSANVVEYAIFKNDNQVGHFRKNALCRFPEYNELLKYEPLSEHSILPYGYDEEDEYWEDDVQNLEVYLRQYILFDKVIREY